MSNKTNLNNWKQLINDAKATKSRGNFVDSGHFIVALSLACDRIEELEAENTFLNLNLSSGGGKQPLRGLVFKKLKEKIAELSEHCDTFCKCPSHGPTLVGGFGDSSRQEQIKTLEIRLAAAEAAVVQLSNNPAGTGPRKDLSQADQAALDAWVDSWRLAIKADSKA